MARMRTIPEAIRHIKAVDPETSLTQHGLRLLVLNGDFPHIRIGVKRLVDADLLEKYLSGDYIPQKQSTPEPSGVIRRLPENLSRLGGR